MITPLVLSIANLQTSVSAATSADGTDIGYLSIGDGPGIVILHGAMQSPTSQIDLARLLAGGHTIHLVNRRGRGRSGAYPRHFSTATEVDDLAAVLRDTGASDVMGVSSGAIIAARAALALPEINRIALFEPPNVVNGSLPLDFVERYERELADGDIASAMVTAMLGAQMGPSFLAAIPRPFLRAMTRRMLDKNDAKPLAQGDAHLRDLAYNLRYDFMIVAEMEDRVGDFAAIDQEVLLLGGTKSRPYLRAAIAALARTIPHARAVELPGADHSATQNRSDRGNPELVAESLRSFFS